LQFKYGKLNCVTVVFKESSLEFCILMKMFEVIAV
jgi:hypothetical protein